jgi:hypothetical protein
MKFIFKFATRALRKGMTKIMDRFGSKLVSGMADTSSDAPNAFHKPKRDLYSTMTEKQENT